MKLFGWNKKKEPLDDVLEAQIDNEKERETRQEPTVSPAYLNMDFGLIGGKTTYHREYFKDSMNIEDDVRKIKERVYKAIEDGEVIPFGDQEFVNGKAVAYVRFQFWRGQ